MDRSGSELDHKFLLAGAAADVVGDLLAALRVGGHLHVVAGLLLAGTTRARFAAAVPVDGVQDQLHGAQKAPAPVGDLHARINEIQ